MDSCSKKNADERTMRYNRQVNELTIISSNKIWVRHSCVTRSGRESRSDSIYLCPSVQSVRIDVVFSIQKFEVSPVGSTHKHFCYPAFDPEFLVGLTLSHHR